MNPLKLEAGERYITRTGWIMCKDRMPREADDPQKTGVPTARGGKLIGLYRWDAEVFSERAISFFPLPAPPAPEVKRVPLGLSDVWPSSPLFRHKDTPNGEFGPAQSFHPMGVAIFWCDPVNEEVEMEFVPWAQLMKTTELSRDGGKTWEPCSKEVEA